MLKLYIDESGNLGPQGRYFVIGGLCTEDGKRIRNILKRHCAGEGVDEFKNRDTSFQHRQNIVRKIKSAIDHEVAYICIDKDSIQNRKLLEDNNLMFNYAFGFLMKEIIRTHLEKDIRVTIDNRNQKVFSINSLGDYIKIKAFTDWGYRNSLEFCYCDSKDDRLIQAADLIAGTVLEKYKRNKNHLYQLLKPQYSIKFPHQNFGN